MQEWVYRLDHDPVVVAESRLPAPSVTYLGDGRWRLEQAYVQRDRDTTITAPAGFEFDLSSVPRIFWSLIAPFELSIAAPLLHDFLYRHGGKLPAGAVSPPRAYTRAEADRMFREIMRAEGVSAWRRALGYATTRVFGRSAWRG
ncbi:MAG: DUF1353 domain-containing protein [Gaiellaceae bacterium]